MTILSLRGSDTLDLLQRISTNDLLSLTPGSARPTVFITDKAKIMAYAVVLCLPDQILIVAERPEEDLRAWIERFIIMEDVTLEDLTGRYRTYISTGRKAEERTGHTPESGNAVVHLPESAGFSFRDDRWAIPSFITVEEIRPGTVQSERYGQFIDENTFEFLRIGQGVPRMGRELTGGVNPLEAMLTGAVSFTKGCYIGQEVVARLDTYHKVQKHLFGMVFDSALPLVSPGHLWTVDGTEAGTVTSSVFAPTLQRMIGLGYIKAAVQTHSPHSGQDSIVPSQQVPGLRYIPEGQTGGPTATLAGLKEMPVVSGLLGMYNSAALGI